MPPCQEANVQCLDALDNLPKAKRLDGQSPPQKPEYDPVLRRLYIATTYFCFSMVGWIMLLPASWLIGRSRLHREVILPYLEKQTPFFLVVPSSIVSKYQGHSLVHFTHLVPSAIWAAIIPFQLHPTWRQNNRKLHRILGYFFLATTFLVAIGVIVILHRKLTYEHFFPDLEPNLGHAMQKYFMAAMAIWFVATAIQSVRMARAKKIREHQKWMYRHVASGIWIAVQRLVFIPLAIAYVKLILGPSEKPSQWIQREIFAGSAELSYVICIYLGEYAHKRVSQQPVPQRKEKEN